MDIHIYQVDAFTDKIFGGNPAGIVISPRNLTEELMQNIAEEMNLSLKQHLLLLLVETLFSKILYSSLRN